MWPDLPRTQELLDQAQKGRSKRRRSVARRASRAAAAHDRPAPRPGPGRASRRQRHRAGRAARGPSPAERLPAQSRHAVSSVVAAHRQGSHDRRPPPPSLGPAPQPGPRTAARARRAGRSFVVSNWPDRFSIRNRRPPPRRSARSFSADWMRAIAALEEDDREVILMRHGEQLSNQEVATVLGLTEAAASMRYLRAVRRLRAELLPGG